MKCKMLLDPLLCILPPESGAKARRTSRLFARLLTALAFSLLASSNVYSNALVSDSINSQIDEWQIFGARNGAIVTQLADERVTIIWANGATGQTSIWHMQGTQRSSVAFPGGIQNANWTLTGIGDFDGSGFSDYFWRAPFVGAGQNRIWLVEDDEVSAAGAIPAIGPDWEFFGAGDFNGDGKDDLLWRQTNPLTGQNRAWLMDGLQRTQGSAIPLFPGAEWIPAGIGDLNGDGRDDIVWRSLSRAQTRIWLMDGFGIGSAGPLPIMPSFWAVAGVSDFDGDGQDDLLWRDEQAGQNRIWLMNGTTVNDRGTINLIGPESWQARGVGDLDGDGKADIVWRNAFTGRNRVWLMNGLTRKQGAAIPIESDLNWRIVGVGTASADGTAPPPPAATGKLNDTGIDWCADFNTNNLDCPVSGWPGQDGDFGRDALARDGQLDKVGAGAAGFDFTKLDANGNDLPVTAMDWSCVRDNHTGLIWEVKTDDGGLRDKDNTYSWYDPDSDTNGGDAGDQDFGSCVGSDCDTSSFADAVNARGLCGASDWRMPGFDELVSIVHYGRRFPAIDTDYFPNTTSDDFWSAQAAEFSIVAWEVNFDEGFDSDDIKIGSNRVRLVRRRQ